MKAIILAAGRGSRMQALTSEQPKCFTVLYGKKLIDWQLDALKAAGFEDIAIVRGYLAESFKYNVRYFDNPRWAETNMLMSLYQAQEWLNEDICIVSYSDIVYSAKSVERLMQADGDISITYDPKWLDLWSLRFEDPLSDAETFKINELSELVEIGGRAKTTEEIRGQFMGLLKFTPKGWSIVEDYLKNKPQEVKDKFDMTKLLRGLIAEGVKINAVKIDEPWYEVDNENDLRKYQEAGNFAFATFRSSSDFR